MDSDVCEPFHFDIGSGAAVWSWRAFAGVGYRTGWADFSFGYRHLSFQNHGEGVPRKLSMGGEPRPAIPPVGWRDHDRLIHGPCRAGGMVVILASRAELRLYWRNEGRTGGVQA